MTASPGRSPAVSAASASPRGSTTPGPVTVAAMQVGDAEQARDLGAGRAGEDRRRRARLQAAPVGDHHDLVGEEGRLLGVVGHDDAWRGPSRAGARRSSRRRSARTGTSRALKRLVEQEHPRGAREGLGQGDALALAPGELGGVAPGEPARGRGARASRLASAARPRRRSVQVAPHGEVREEREALGDVADAAIARPAWRSRRRRRSATAPDAPASPASARRRVDLPEPDGPSDGEVAGRRAWSTRRRNVPTEWSRSKATGEVGAGDGGARRRDLGVAPTRRAHARLSAITTAAARQRQGGRGERRRQPDAAELVVGVDRQRGRVVGEDDDRAVLAEGAQPGQQPCPRGPRAPRRAARRARSARVSECPRVAATSSRAVVDARERGARGDDEERRRDEGHRDDDAGERVGEVPAEVPAEPGVGAHEVDEDDAAHQRRQRERQRARPRRARRRGASATGAAT